MIFKLKAPPAPVRCYTKTSTLKLECGLSGGLKPIADLWKVTIQLRPADTIRAIQTAMIEYEIKAGNMPRSFTVQAWVTVSMDLDPSLRRHENRAKFTKLCAEARLPFKSVERTSKPKIRNGAVHLSFWSKGFAAKIEDRIYFLDDHKVLEVEDIDLDYPETFPKLPDGLFYQSSDLKAGDFRG